MFWYITNINLINGSKDCHFCPSSVIPKRHRCAALLLIIIHFNHKRFFDIYFATVYYHTVLERSIVAVCFLEFYRVHRRLETQEHSNILGDLLTLLFNSWVCCQNSVCHSYESFTDHQQSSARGHFCNLMKNNECTAWLVLSIVCT